MIIVNDYFKDQKDRNYIGSQDIDIGFSLKPMRGKTELESTNLFKMLNILEKNDYKPSLFGYKKDIPFKNSGFLEDEEKEETFTIYVDILVNSYPQSYQDIHQNSFFEVPLIEKIYNDKKYQIKIPEISKYLFIPNRNMMIAMKIISLPSREKNHKMIKDLCDLYTLIWSSDKSTNKIVNEISEILQPKRFKRLKEKINKNLMKTMRKLS
ncbi:MAG: hypothetical protein V5A68_06920 [Candidatus Thermoplasmatota archaeon]